MLVRTIVYDGRKVLRRRKIQGKINWRKMHGILASAAARKGNVRYVVRVEYGYATDCFGKRQMFYNEYDGHDRNEAIRALSAFIEE